MLRVTQDSYNDQIRVKFKNSIHLIQFRFMCSKVHGNVVAVINAKFSSKVINLAFKIRKDSVVVTSGTTLHDSFF